MALHFWAAPAAARKAGTKSTNVRKTPDRISIIVGAVLAILAVVGVMLLMTGQLHF
jgi:cytochrome c biogenesis protein CcdA